MSANAHEVQIVYKTNIDELGRLLAEQRETEQRANEALAAGKLQASWLWTRCVARLRAQALEAAIACMTEQLQQQINRETNQGRNPGNQEA